MEENNTYQPEQQQNPSNEEQAPASYPNARPRFSAEQSGQKRGNIGGYVAVGAVCLLVGLALGSLITGLVSLGASGISALIREGVEHAPEDIWEWDWEWKRGFGPSTEEPQPAPESTKPEQVEPPEYVSRPLPVFDGQAPALGNAVNPLPDIVEHSSEGVVGLDIYYASESGDEDFLGSYGSGFIVSSEGYIITNAHVVEDASRVMVKFTDGDELQAEMVGADTRLDVAVLKIESADSLTSLALGTSADVRVGDFAVAIGNPTGEKLADTATFGIISATSRETNVDGRINSYLQTDAAINPGSSGGPLLDMQGRVIGITSAKTLYAGYDDYGNMVNAEGIGYAIPIDDAMKVVEELITTGHVVRPGIGISVVTIDAYYAEEYDIPEGVLVYTVTRNGPAHQADLRVNDIILSYNGVIPGEHSDLVDYVAGLQVGDTIDFHIWRDGKEMDITLTIADLNLVGTEILGGKYADIID
ncbi:MAG: trypsin-like peptidase domain-containing protein [Candidatus Pelethousia sp.]|nr:trypsin-like peptidase domain-containing protein [Candidatus Pelethousia sp.]